MDLLDILMGTVLMTGEYEMPPTGRVITWVHRSTRVVNFKSFWWLADQTYWASILAIEISIDAAQDGHSRISISSYINGFVIVLGGSGIISTILVCELLSQPAMKVT